MFNCRNEKERTDLTSFAKVFIPKIYIKKKKKRNQETFVKHIVRVFSVYYDVISQQLPIMHSKPTHPQFDVNKLYNGSKNE